MQKTFFVIAFLTWSISILCTTLSFSDELKPIKLLEADCHSVGNRQDLSSTHMER